MVHSYDTCECYCCKPNAGCNAPEPSKSGAFPLSEGNVVLCNGAACSIYFPEACPVPGRQPGLNRIKLTCSNGSTSDSCGSTSGHENSNNNNGNGTSTASNTVTSSTSSTSSTNTATTTTKKKKNGAGGDMRQHVGKWRVDGVVVNGLIVTALLCVLIL
ncbi:hypothetical protein HDU76_009127 [Blyttiomyces sp. JEL0837]|nr:hypothetical protein HDU76_009127 [Blyttiomyces sp. JEL0837]